MLAASIDASAIEHRLEMMGQNLDGFDIRMADEFSDWQIEDVNRKNARTNTEPNLVWTIFTRGRNRFGRKWTGPIDRRARPILRPVLFEQLRLRMIDLMQEEITWR